MQISFGDGAFDAFVRTVQTIPDGWTVALLGEGEDPDPGSDLAENEVAFQGADQEGVSFGYLTLDGQQAHADRTPCAGANCAWLHDAGHTVEGFKSWDEVARIHIY